MFISELPKDSSCGQAELQHVDFAALSYLTRNLGDEIQTLAADRFIPAILKRFDRDTLRLISDKQRYVIILNGWYSMTPEKCFPVPENLIPAIIGFHISVQSKDYMLAPPGIAYFKKYEPIGCRDKQTMLWLLEAGVRAYFSKCLTLTLPQRVSEPRVPRVMIVDIPPRVHSMIPTKYRKNAVYVTHRDTDSPDQKLKKAQQLLNDYRDHAGLVITSRLHSALPCLAMGIPVVLFADHRDYRFSVARDVGLPIHRETLFVRSSRPGKGYVKRKIHRTGVLLDRILLSLWYKVLNRSIWKPTVLDIEVYRNEIKEQVRRAVLAAVAKWRADERLQDRDSDT